MDPARPFVVAAVAGVTGSLVLLLVGFVAETPGPWWQAHAALVGYGGVLPALLALHAHTLQRFGRGMEMLHARRGAAVLLVAAVVLAAAAAAAAVTPATAPAPLAVAADILLLVGAALFVVAATALAAIFRRGAPIGSVVDVAVDPLTKGDDACWLHLRIATWLLAAAAIVLFAAAMPGAPEELQRVRLAGIHVLFAGYGLLSVYGLGHLWVPRLSGVPAIAVGAIKGELHATLLGLAGLVVGLATGWTGFIVGFGPFVFLGFFTFMGVLGANIMRNKSVTQRVTPEFVYVPWTFAAIFWLVSGVLLGLFLNAIPESLAHFADALRWTHTHATLFAGVLMLLMGFATRIAPAASDRPPVRFAGAVRGSFLLTNLAFVAAIVMRFWVGAMASGEASGQASGAGTADLWFAAANAAIIVGLVLFAWAMKDYLRHAFSRRPG